MSARSDDLERHTREQRQQWDSVAAGWKKWWRTIESGAQHVSKRMLELAAVKPGQRVLDIATGIGEPALLAASIVGAAGRVVATDLSPQMLGIARERAATSGLNNIEFIEAEAGQLSFPDGSFDVVLCRWGITSLPNPASALVAIRHMLAANGSFVTAVWQAEPKGRPMASIATAVARDRFDLPSPRPELPSRSGSVEDALEKEMVRAGFAHVRVEELTLTLAFPSVEDCTQYLVDVSPDFAILLSDKSPGQRTEYRQRVAEKLRQYTMVDGSVRVPNVTICAVARR